MSARKEVPSLDCRKCSRKKIVGEKTEVAHIGLIVVTTMVLAQNPEVVPLNFNAFGNTYGEWSARWWRWALSIPADQNPLLDTTGANCSEGQGGQIWFLAGVFGGAATHSCTVSGGKALFFPNSQHRRRGRSG